MKYFMLKFAISGMGGIISGKKDLKMLWFAYTFYFNILTMDYLVRLQRMGELISQFF